MKKAVVFLTIILFNFKGFSNNPKKDPKLGGWYMYFGNVKIENTKWIINYDVQYRNYEIISDLNQLLMRTSVQYALFDNLTLGGGYAFVHTEQLGIPDNPFNENRIFQDVITQQKIATATVKHRFRFEQRFMENQDFKSRLRYQLGLDVLIYQNTEKNQNLYATMYNEIFMNADETSRKSNVFDRDRLYFGAGFKFNQNLGVQVGWMNQMLQKTSHQQLMFSLHHNLKLK
ncbi:DUF2490 domain-containing protein [Flavobacterium dauae]|uniref:DUF2490 domain-containing protein n=1 Tax=Flavobacterium dauae TaxID=1563479 RepID=UPI00101B3D14|nr:DUF2490 domain-containing protein [Flavobacterium dauae]WLD24955.1 DUF2490 domain-containing protein [Flavobacterium dauae]